MSEFNNDDMAQALALSMEGPTVKTREELEAEEEEAFQRILQLSITEAREEEVVINISELVDVETSDTSRLEEENMRRALEMSVNDSLIIPPLTLVDSLDDSELQQVLAMSMTDGNSDGHMVKMQSMMAAAGYLSPGRKRQCLEVGLNTGGLVVGVKFKHALSIAATAGGNCKIRFLSQSRNSQVKGVDGDCLVIEADTDEALNRAEKALFLRIAAITVTPVNLKNNENKSKTTKKSPKRVTNLAALQNIKQKLNDFPLQTEKRRHVFVDNSNLFIGAQTRDTARTKKINYNVRVNASTMATLLRQPASTAAARSAGGDVSEGANVVAGSKPPASGAIWAHWVDVGFKVKICSRDVDTGREDLVDDFLHAQVLGALMGRKRHDDAPGDNTLVLCTGDANDNGGFNNFFEVVVNALEAHWRVEIWAWRHACSKKFKELAILFPDRLSVKYLDDYTDLILFNAKAKTVSVNTQNTTAVSLEAIVKNDDVVVDEVVMDDVKEDAVMDEFVRITLDDVDAEAEDDEDDDEDLCIICMEGGRTHAVIPCGHQALCAACAALLTESGESCPCCRGPIGSFLHIYR